MRILYSCSLDPAGQAAAGGHVINVVKELTHLGHTVTLIHMGPPLPDLGAARQIALGKRASAPASPLWRNTKLGREIAREWCAGAYDVVYHRFDKSNVLAPLIARLWRMPLVVEVNSDLRSEPYFLRMARSRRVLIQDIERINYRCANHLVVVAEGIERAIAEMYGVPSRQVTVIPNGTDVGTFRPMERDKCLRALGLQADKRYVAFTGTFQVWQGLGTVIEACAQLRETHPEAICLLIGDGPERAWVERQMQSLDMSQCFLLPGWCSPEQTALYLGAADVCVAPYTRDAATVAGPAEDTRGAMMRRSPLKIYTYLAAGRPVIASDFAEAGLLVEELGAGIAIPPERPDCLAKAICHILENPQQAEWMGRAARQVAEERFGWRAVAERVADVCEQVRRAHAH